VAIAALAALASATGCGSNDSTAPSANVPFSSTDLTVGTGATAASGNTVTVNYTGWLYDSSRADNKGTQFDSSLTAGRTPLVFQLGTGRVIQGWDRGVVGMKVGGSRRLVIPPDLGYGSAGFPPAIPSNATLVFDISLLAVQ
jgi:FKBP-type peptidyl-prolyl cis-trans isomerase